MGEEGCCIPTISTLTVDVVTNTSSLSKGLKLAGTAVLAVGAIATKMALDYENAFTKIAAVSNASAADIEKWKSAVLSLAGETAQAPKDLADALFFLASAGLKTNQIMPVLEASAKAAAAGLGDVSDITKLTSNVLNAYAGSGIKAADVTDTLVAAVREGSADTDEFGTAIGRILPIASAAGIGFDSVAASLASLSNIGLDVNEGVTAMRGLFQALVAPTVAASSAMEGVGLSSQQLLDSLQQDGLIATIRLLDGAVKKNTGTQADYLNTLRTIVPNIRSLTGLLGLTSQQAERVDGIFKRVDDSTGSLGEAFKTTAEGPGFQFKQALAEIQVLMIQLGDVILPVLVSIVGFIEENWTPAWDAVSKAVGDAWDAVKPFAEAIGHVLIPLLMTAWHTFQDRLLPVLQRLKPLFIVIGAAVVLFATMIVAQFALVVTAVGFVIDKFLDLVGFVRDKLVEPVVNALGRVVAFVKGPFIAVWDNVVAPIGRSVGKIIGFVGNLIDQIQSAIDKVLSFENALAHAAIEAGVFDNITVGGGNGRSGLPGNIPGGASGGFVARSGLAVIHKGETLTPAGAGGLTININADIVSDHDALVRKIEDALATRRRRTGDLAFQR